MSRGNAGGGNARRGVAGFRRWLAHWLRSLVPGSRPLCDTCRYDYGNVCKRPERPNALRCPDYRRK